jgi:hypothetical protein
MTAQGAARLADAHADGAGDAVGEDEVEEAEVEQDLVAAATPS